MKKSHLALRNKYVDLLGLANGLSDKTKEKMELRHEEMQKYLIETIQNPEYRFTKSRHLWKSTASNKFETGHARAHINSSI